MATDGTARRIGCGTCGQRIRVVRGRLAGHDAHGFRCPGSGERVRPVEQRAALRRVERAAARVRRDDAELRAAVVAAREVDAPLRAIAQAAHVSHPKVIEMLRAEATS